MAKETTAAGEGGGAVVPTSQRTGGYFLTLFLQIAAGSGEIVEAQVADP
jgi:hypothetical protein